MVERREQSAPAGWRGRIYYNPADPSLWVEKRRGIGWTLNFGNPRSWWVLALILAPAVLVPALLARYVLR